MYIVAEDVLDLLWRSGSDRLDAYRCHVLDCTHTLTSCSISELSGRDRLLACVSHVCCDFLSVHMRTCTDKLQNSDAQRQRQPGCTEIRRRACAAAGRWRCKQQRPQFCVEAQSSVSSARGARKAPALREAAHSSDSDFPRRHPQGLVCIRGRHHPPQVEEKFGQECAAPRDYQGSEARAPCGTTSVLADRVR